MFINKGLLREVSIQLLLKTYQKVSYQTSSSSFPLKKEIKSIGISRNVNPSYIKCGWKTSSRSLSFSNTLRSIAWRQGAGNFSKILVVLEWSFGVRNNSLFLYKYIYMNNMKRHFCFFSTVNLAVTENFFLSK